MLRISEPRSLGIEKGNEYSVIKQVVSIVITDHPLIPESPRYHHRFTFYDPEAKVEFTDLIEINVLEIPKLPEKPAVYLWSWLRFLRAETKEELDMTAQASPMIHKAVAKVLELSEDERFRMLEDAREMQRMDNASMLRDATRKGRAEGQAVGRKEEARAIARNLLGMNLLIDQIAAATGMSAEEIEALRAEG